MSKDNDLISDSDHQVMMTLPGGEEVVRLSSIQAASNTLRKRMKWPAPSISARYAYTPYLIRDHSGYDLAGLLINETLQNTPKEIVQFTVPREDTHERRNRIHLIFPFLDKYDLATANFTRVLMKAKDVDGSWHSFGSLPIGFTHKGDLDIFLNRENEAFALPNKMTVIGNLKYQAGRKVMRLPDDLIVTGDLHVEGAFEFGSRISVRGNATFICCDNTDSDINRSISECASSIDVRGSLQISAGQLKSVPENLLNNEQLSIGTESEFEGISSRRRKYTSLHLTARKLKTRIPEGISVSFAAHLGQFDGVALPKVLISHRMTDLFEITGYPSLRDWRLSGRLWLDDCHIFDLPNDLELFALVVNDCHVLTLPKRARLSSFSLAGKETTEISTAIDFSQSEHSSFTLCDTAIRNLEPDCFIGFEGIIKITDQDFLPCLPEELKERKIKYQIHRIGSDLETLDTDWYGYNQMRERLNRMTIGSRSI